MLHAGRRGTGPGHPFHPRPQSAPWLAGPAEGVPATASLPQPGSRNRPPRASAGLDTDAAFGYDRKLSPTLYRHYTAVREFLGIQPYIGTDANEVTIRAAREAKERMDQPVEIINASTDALILHQIDEQPAFSTLDAIAKQIHARTQTALFRRVARRLSDEEQQRLNRLLTQVFANRQSAYKGSLQKTDNIARQAFVNPARSWLPGSKGLIHLT